MDTPSLWQKFKSRKFLLTLFAQITGLLVVLLPEYESQITEAAAHVTGLLMMALTLFGYLQAESAIDAAREQSDGRIVTSKLQLDAIERSRSKGNGTTAAGLIGALLLAPVLALAGGCAATPEDRWYQQRDALNAANRVYLANQANLTDDEIVTYGELLQAARASLDAAKNLLPQGGPTFNAYLDIVESILVKFSEEAPDDGTRDSVGVPNGPGADRPGPDSVRPAAAARPAHARAAAGDRAGRRADRRAGGRRGGGGQGPHRRPLGVVV